MGMRAHYLQISPEQTQALDTLELRVVSSTFDEGGSLAPSSFRLGPLTASVLLVSMAGAYLWFEWRRSSPYTRSRLWAAVALFMTALVIVGVRFRDREPVRAASTAQVAEPLCIEKTWSGIHFLLNGTADGGKPPLFNVVLGGEETGEDFGYGPARYLTPDQVKEVAAALEPITKKALRARFDARAMAREGIYTWNEDEGDDQVDDYLDRYAELRAYFVDAARKGNGMLICIR